MSRTELPDYSSIVRWTVQDVANWLVQAGFSEYVKKFRDGGVDGRRLADMTEIELEKLRLPLKMKMQREFMNHINGIKGKVLPKKKGGKKLLPGIPNVRADRPPHPLPNVQPDPQDHDSDGSNEGWGDDFDTDGSSDSYENEDLRPPPTGPRNNKNHKVNGQTANGPVEDVPDQTYEDPDQEQPPPIVPRPGQRARPLPSNPGLPPGPVLGRPPPPIPSVSAPVPVPDEQPVYEDPDEEDTPTPISRRPFSTPADSQDTYEDPDPLPRPGVPRPVTIQTAHKVSSQDVKVKPPPLPNRPIPAHTHAEDTDDEPCDYEVPEDNNKTQNKKGLLPPGARKVLPLPPVQLEEQTEYEEPDLSRPGPPPLPINRNAKAPKQTEPDNIPGRVKPKGKADLQKGHKKDYIEPEPDIKMSDSSNVYEIAEDENPKPFILPMGRGPLPTPGKTADHKDSTDSPAKAAPRSKGTPLPLPPSQDVSNKHGGRGLPSLPNAGAVEESLDSYPWYHGNATRPAADAKLKQQCTNGMFLVRKSSRDGSRQPYTLVLFNEQQVFNLPIRKRTDGKFALGMEKKDEYTHISLPVLIEFFKKNMLVLHSSGPSQTCLTKAAPK